MLTSTMRQKKSVAVHADATPLVTRPKAEIAAAEAHVRGILRFVGEDVKREGLLETPARVVRAFAEHFAGYGLDPGQYLVKLTAGGKTLQTTVTVRPDVLTR